MLLVSYFFSSHDLDLQLSLDVLAVLLVLLALLLGGPHLLLEDVQNVGSLNVGGHLGCVVWGSVCP